MGSFLDFLVDHVCNEATDIYVDLLDKNYPICKTKFFVTDPLNKRFWTVI